MAPRQNRKSIPDHEGNIPAAEQQARQHASVRHAHETELIEDYVELIADLVDFEGGARAVELAQRFGVAQATVAKMLRRLSDHGLIVREPYRAIHLTESGRALAENSRQRHALVLSLLRALGVSEETARQDAEGIEHHVSQETLEVMRRYLSDE